MAAALPFGTSLGALNAATLYGKDAMLTLSSALSCQEYHVEAGLAMTLLYRSDSLTSSQLSRQGRELCSRYERWRNRSSEAAVESLPARPSLSDATAPIRNGFDLSDAFPAAWEVVCAHNLCATLVLAMVVACFACASLVRAKRRQATQDQKDEKREALLSEYVNEDLRSVTMMMISAQ